jgi:hypothetical protein
MKNTQKPSKLELLQILDEKTKDGWAAFFDLTVFGT